METNIFHFLRDHMVFVRLYLCVCDGGMGDILILTQFTLTGVQ